MAAALPVFRETKGMSPRYEGKPTGHPRPARRHHPGAPYRPAAALCPLTLPSASRQTPQRPHQRQLPGGLHGDRWNCPMRRTLAQARMSSTLYQSNRDEYHRQSQPVPPREIDCARREPIRIPHQTRPPKSIARLTQRQPLRAAGRQHQQSPRPFWNREVRGWPAPTNSFRQIAPRIESAASFHRHLQLESVCDETGSPARAYSFSQVIKTPGMKCERSIRLGVGESASQKTRRPHQEFVRHIT